MRKPTWRGVARVVFGVAALFMAPAVLYTGLESGVRVVMARRPAVEERMAATVAAHMQRSLVCGADGGGNRITPSQMEDLWTRLDGATWRLGLEAFRNEVVMDAATGGLPLSGGFAKIREATRALYETFRSVDRSKLCRDPDPELGARVEEAEGRLASLRRYGEKEEAEALREAIREAIREARAERLKEPDGREYEEAWKAEEARSQAAYEEIRGKLVGHQAALGRAWEQFERDRPKVAVVAWTLAILEVVGWLAGLLILPGEIRTLRARWAARREGRGPPR
jgi:hypothetical protein